MTLTMQQYSDQKTAQNTIQLNVTKYCLMLCDALQHNYQQRNHGKVGGYDAPNYTFAIDGGRKYHKIWMYINGKRSSIHAFVDKKTGEVFKPASVKAPAKGARYNLLLINDREWLFGNADWAGGYLYR